MKLLLRPFLVTFLAVLFATLTGFTQTAAVSTDLLDYPPGSTAIITGTGFQPGETVAVCVKPVRVANKTAKNVTRTGRSNSFI